MGPNSAGTDPINFVSPGVIADADIVVNDGSVFQSMAGFGGTLTDSSALILQGLKSRNPSNYYNLLNAIFNPVDGAAGAGINYIRVPIGATDFSSSRKAAILVFSIDDNVHSLQPR